METKRFRNHYSSVFEKFFGGIVAIIVIFFFNMIGEGSVEDIETAEEVIEVPSYIIAIVIGAIILLVGVIIGWMSWVWSKTWIVLEENAISVEKNTLIYNKNTLGIKDISNVNLEQNLFEMIIGTSKVKINTNSFSTAATTDLKIILKKKDAEKLKTVLNDKIRQLNVDVEENIIVTTEAREDNTNAINPVVELNEIKTSVKDIVLNSIFSINILFLFIFVLVIASFIFNTANMLFGETVVYDYLFKNLTMTIGIVVIVIMLVITIVANCIKTFFKMYSFSVKRVGDKLIIKYGLLKQVEYTVPVDKVNAVVIHQTLIARIFKKYTVEIVNVGMGDEMEDNTYLCLYGRKEKVIDTIKSMLPEYASAIDDKVERQPKSTIVLKVINNVVVLAVLCVIGAIITYFINEALTIVVIAIVGLMFIAIITQICSFMIDGMSMSDEFFSIARGTFAKNRTIMKMEKIQYITVYESFLARRLGIARGNVNILAMLGKNIHSLPFFKKEKAEEIKKKLLETC